MGASALKNKVGKLIFTIILSFIAFTIFGIFDALSQWNRADSVYEAMQINSTKPVVLRKRTYRSDWNEYDDDITTAADLKKLNEIFTDRTIKGVATGDFYMSQFRRNSSYINVEGGNDDPLYSTDISGFVHLTDEERKNYDFDVYKGRLPIANNEIAISRYTMEALIKLTSNETEESKKITEENIIPVDYSDELSLFVSIRNFDGDDYADAKIVGVIDDKTNYQKYKDIDSTKRMEKRWSYESFFESSFLRIAYVSEERFKLLEEQGSDGNLYFSSSNSSHGTDKSNFGSLESMYLDSCENKNDSISYHCEIDGQRYKLSGIKNSYWEIRKIIDSNAEVYVYHYSYAQGTSPDTLQDQAYAQLDDAEKTEFFSGTGIGIFGADADGDKIPDAFIEGNVFRDEWLEGRMLYYKGGGSVLNAEGNFVDIGEGNVILTKNMATSLLGVEYQEKIEAGATVDLERDGRFVKAYTVVGVSNGNIYFSNKEYEETILAQFQGYDMIVTSLTGNDSADEKFVKFCENGDFEGGAKWAVQNSTTSLLNQFEGFILSAAKIFLYIALGFAVFASLMLMNFISTSISYKKREIGVLRALGARGSDVFGIFFNESLIIALINFVLATTATIITCMVVNSILVTKLGVDIVLLVAGIRQVILILGVSVLAAFIGSFLPTFKVSRKRPIDAINNR